MDKEFLFNYPSDQLRILLAIIYQSDQPKPLRVIEETVFKLWNDLLKKKDDRTWHGSTQLGFPREEESGKLFGFSTETGILDMLEAFGYRKIDAVTPFLVEIVDVYCRNNNAAHATEVSSLYVNIANYKYKRIISRAGQTKNVIPGM